MSWRVAWARLRRGLPRIARLSPRELLATGHALAVLALVETLIRFVRLSRLTRLLGVRLDLTPAGDVPPAPVDLPPEAVRRLQATARVVHVWPFCQGPCLRQSLVAAHLLREQGAALRLGIVGSADTLSAHAWVELDGRALEDVTGLAVLHAPATVASP
jgi:hypothetical protein